MKYSLTIRKEAELDINSAFEYYENLRLGLGHDFLLCIEAALSKIERNPLQYKVIYKAQTHRCPPFPLPDFLFSPKSINHSYSSFSCKARPSILDLSRHITMS